GGGGGGGVGGGGGAGGAGMFEAMRQVEICLGARPIRAAVFKALNGIYHEAFLEPRLKSQSLVAVPLDPNFPQDKDVPSEIEIKGPGAPPQVLMGRRAPPNPRSALAPAAPPARAPPHRAAPPPPPRPPPP